MMWSVSQTTDSKERIGKYEWWEGPTSHNRREEGKYTNTLTHMEILTTTSQILSGKKSGRGDRLLQHITPETLIRSKEEENVDQKRKMWKKKKESGVSCNLQCQWNMNHDSTWFFCFHGSWNLHRTQETIKYLQSPFLASRGKTSSWQEDPLTTQISYFGGSASPPINTGWSLQSEILLPVEIRCKQRPPHSQRRPKR